MASTVVVLHDSLLLAVPVPVFFGIPLVVFFLAGSNGNFAFDQMLFPVEREGNNGFAFLILRFAEFVEFPAVEQ